MRCRITSTIKLAIAGTQAPIYSIVGSYIVVSRSVITEWYVARDRSILLATILEYVIGT